MFGRDEVPIPAPLMPPPERGLRVSSGAPVLPRTAERPFGVNVAGYLRAELGIGEVARQMVSALDAADVPLLPIGLHAPNSRQGHEFVTGEQEANPFAVNIICVNADGLPRFAESAGPAFFAERYSIGMWWWEVSAFPHVFESSFDLVDEIWVGSRFVADALLAVSPVPVVPVPIPIEFEDATPLEPGELGWPDAFTFLFSFDYNSVFGARTRSRSSTPTARRSRPATARRSSSSASTAKATPSHHALMQAGDQRIARTSS